MMSMFSSFDMNMNAISMIIYLLMSSILLCNLNIICNFSFLINSINFNLSVFISSIKPKNYSKFTKVILVSAFNLWLFINLSSIFSYNFALTSQISVVMFISLMTWISFIMFMMSKKMESTLSHWIPEGSPIMISMFLFLIEMISNVIRPITVTVRMVANILSGHLIMILLSKMAINFNMTTLAYLGLNSVEMGVALIQAYIFMTMFTLYYSEI